MIENWLLVGSWIGAGFLGGGIMYYYMNWKLDKLGLDWKMMINKISDDKYRNKFTEDR